MNKKREYFKNLKLKTTKHDQMKKGDKGPCLLISNANKIILSFENKVTNLFRREVSRIISTILILFLGTFK